MTTEFNHRQQQDGFSELPVAVNFSQISNLFKQAESQQVLSFDKQACQTGIIALGFPHFQIGDEKKSEAPEARGERQSPAEKAESRLKAAAEKAIADPNERADFLKYMQEFKERASRDRLQDGEYTKTLDQVSRLLEAKEGKVSAEQRTLAARGILYNAARPDTICQIGGTCGVASTEHKVFSKHPSVAADMVASAAIKGEWTGRDGQAIKLPEQTLAAEENHLKFPPAAGQPSYASQLFQIAAVNDIGQHLKPPMTYVRGPRVEQKEGNSTVSFTPENWVMENGEKRPFAKPGTGVFSRTGGLTSFEVANEIYRLTGEKSGVISNRAHDNDDCPAEQRPPGISDDNLTDVKSQQELEGELKKRKGEGKLPVVVCVSAAAVSKLDGSLSFIGQKQDHFVTIDDYKPAENGKPAQIHLHNQWGPNFNGWMNLNDFYKATTNNPIKLDGKWKENRK
jgi:hypothetical protein